MIAYWAVVLASMNSVVDKSKLDYLLPICRSYTPVQRAALEADGFEHRVALIAMTGSALADDNTRAMMHSFQASSALWRNRC